jgi:hypothetical protein
LRIEVLQWLDVIHVLLPISIVLIVLLANALAMVHVVLLRVLPNVLVLHCVLALHVVLALHILLPIVLLAVRLILRGVRLVQLAVGLILIHSLSIVCIIWHIS